MPSPFPGMDPYLEQSWSDVHSALVTYARDQIQTLLPVDLRARMQQRVLLTWPGGQEREVYPDVHVAEHPTPSARRAAGPAVADAAEPLIVYLDDPPIETFIEIVEVGSRRRVVTVIEVLSPSNKQPGRDMDKYLQKRDELVQGRVSIVEVDLLRDGRRLLSAPPA